MLRYAPVSLCKFSASQTGITSNTARGHVASCTPGPLLQTTLIACAMLIRTSGSQLRAYTQPLESCIGLPGRDHQRAWRAFLGVAQLVAAVATAQGPLTGLATAVRSQPGVKSRVLLFSAEASVLLWHLPGCIVSSAIWAAPTLLLCVLTAWM